MSNQSQTPVAFWRLERVGPRLTAAVADFGDDPRLVRYRETTPAIVEAFLEVRREVIRRERETRDLNARAQADSKALYEGVRSWVPAMVRDFPQTDGTLYSQRSQVVENVVEHARTMLHEVQTAQQNGREVSYASVMLEALGSLVEQAEGSSGIAHQAMLELDALREVQRERAVALYQEVLSARGMLRTVLGPKHRVYRRLSLYRVRRDELDAGEVADLDEPELEAAAETEVEDRG